MDADEALNFVQTLTMRGLDPAQRQEMREHLAKLGKGWRVIRDPRLPRALQGKTAPPGWSADHDPWAEVITFG
jgi:hypothetical protein